MHIRLARTPRPGYCRRITRNAVLAGLLLAYSLFQLTHLGGFYWDFDEGIELSKAWLMHDGYRLYADIWADQPPGHAVLLTLAFRLFGISVETGRAVTVFIALIGLVAVAWAAKELDGGWVGALVAATTLAIAPNFFWASRAVMKGLLDFSLATLAMAMALTAHRTGRAVWVAAAGLTFGLALLMKLQMIYLGPLLGLLILLRSWRAPGRLLALAGLHDLTLLASALVAPFVLSCMLFDPRAMFDQVVVTYFQTREAYPVDLAENLGKLWVYLTADNLGLTALAACGAASVLSRPSARGLVTVLWLALTIITAVQHAPLWLQDHFEPLLLVMSILAGVAVADIVRRLRRRPRVCREWGLLIAGVVAATVYLLSLGHVLRVDAMLLTAWPYSNDGDIALPGTQAAQRVEQRRQRMEDAVRYLQTNTRPDDFVVTDYQIIAFRAGRRVPPELAAISSRRIHIGRLNGVELIHIVERYQPPVVLTWAEQLDSFDDFMSWLPTRYEKSVSLGGHRQVYQMRDLPLAPQHPMHVNLGGQVTFLGYSAPERVKPGETLTLTLYWRAEQPVQISYSVFNHLLDAAGQLRAQRDGLPVGGRYPTTAWVPGVVVVDPYEIAIPPDLPPGWYILQSGMYELASLRRLPVAADPTGENAIRLGTILVMP